MLSIDYISPWLLSLSALIRGGKKKGERWGEDKINGMAGWGKSEHFPLVLETKNDKLVCLRKIRDKNQV